MVNRYQIVPAALEGKNLAASSMSTARVERGYFRSFGKLPSRLAHILYLRGDRITQVIYSFDTPIAWLDGDVWVVPDVRYSITTSSHHQSQLWRLPDPVRIPYDCSVNEYDRVISRQMIFSGGRTVPGPEFVLA